MIIDYDHNPNITTDQKVQSLQESVQMALNENDAEHRGFRALVDKSLDKVNATIDSIKESLTNVLTWMKSPELHNSVANTDTYYLAKRDDTNVTVKFGVGSGGTNHGVWSDKLNKWLIYGDDTHAYVNGVSMDVDNRTLSWNSGTAGSGIYVSKWGRLVTLTISNPTKLAVGNNVVATLPTGFRPAYVSVSIMLISPSGAITTGGTNLSLRANINTNGDIEIYNYRSTAINGNTNQSATISYIAA